MGLGTKTVWKCDVCDHEWLSRDESKPLRCANCKTPYWDKSDKNNQPKQEEVEEPVKKELKKSLKSWNGKKK